MPSKIYRPRQSVAEHHRASGRRLLPTLLWCVLALLIGWLWVIAAYWAGGRFVGDYAGDRGLATFMGRIYADASGGSPLALAITAGPLIIFLIWKLRRTGLRWWLDRQEVTQDSADRHS